MYKADVLVLCQFFYPEYISSATLPLEMAEDLVKSGISVNVLCGYPKEYLQKQNSAVAAIENYNGINIRRVKYLQFDRKHSLSRLVNQLSFVISIIFKLSYLLKHKCIIVYSDPPMLPAITALVNHIFKVKVVFVAYDIFPEIAIAMNITKPNSLMSRIMEYINRKVYINSSTIIALSTEMQEYIISHKFQKKSSAIEVIPNWYDKNKLDYGVIKNCKLKTLKDDGNFIVLYSGNMGTCQDMDTIINAISQLKNYNKIFFIFTGHGNKLDKIKNKVVENNLKNVVFYNFLLGDDFSDILQIADCFIVSLEKGLEGLCVPSKTYSYLAAGRPLLAIMSQNTDIARMLKEYNAGFTIEQGNVIDFISKILSLYNDKEKCMKIGENARAAFLKLYERQICTEKYINLFSYLLN